MVDKLGLFFLCETLIFIQFLSNLMVVKRGRERKGLNILVNDGI